MHRQGLLCLLGSMLLLSSFGQLRTDGRKNYSLNGQVYYYTENDAPLSGEEAFSLFRSGAFSPVSTPGNNVNFGYTDRVHWLAFRISISDTIEGLEAGIANAGLYRLDHYQFASNGKLLFGHGPTGKHYPFSSRYIDNRHYYYPLQGSDDQPVTVLFRTDLRGGDFYAPLRLVTGRYRQISEQKLFNFYFFIEGLLVCILLLGVIAILAGRQKVFLYYFLYTLSYALLLFACSDWDFAYLYPQHPGWAVISTAMYGGMTLLFMPCFSIAYLEIKKSHPVLYKISRVVLTGIILLLACIPVFYVSDDGYPARRFVFIYGTVCISAGWLLQFYMVVARVYDRFKPANIYAAANVPVIASAIYFVLHSLGIIKYDEIVLLVMTAAFGMEILVMCIALIYQMNSYRLRHAQLAASLYRQESNFKEQLIHTLETERKRVAEDLHDELGSSLAALKMGLQKTSLTHEELKHILTIVDKASADTRNISHNLMPPEFEKTDIHLLLTNYYSRLSAESAIRFHFHYSGAGDHFTKNEELVLYRIIMELTSNILKHSHATEATIQFIYYNNHIEVMAEDNGRGIQKHDNVAIGMKNIRSRINYLNGEMEIDTGPHGTTIIINIPYKAERENND